MLDKFKQHIKKIVPSGSKLLVAVSGGVDSIVLCELLKKTKIHFSIAHVNYELRGDQSEKDELFLNKYCLDNKIKFYLKRHNLSNQKKSIQEKARKIRYKFFDNLCKQNKYDYILTAHHIDDNIETLLINVYRGKKINVFSGIKEINDNIIRPMLIFSKDDIIKFASENKLKWREDMSNLENKYLRNKIRNILIPKIKSIDPSYRKNFLQLIEKSKIEKKNTNNYLFKIEKIFFETIDNGIIQTDKKKWKDLNSKSVEFILFRKYGFFKNSEIIKILRAPTGKRIFSQSHEIISNRKKLLIKKISDTTYENFEINLGKNKNPINIIVEISKKSKKPLKNEIYISNEVKMPLKVRKFETGDFFYPYGMIGKKKVSKFFKDEKLSIFDKQNKWILTDANNQIIWIIGMRVDRRLVKTDGECLKISI